MTAASPARHDPFGACRVAAVLLLLAGVCFAGPATAYSVDDGRILDDAGHPIQLRGASWYGAEVGDRLVPSGLYKRSYVDVIGELKQLGFNAVRLPFCPAILRHPPFARDYYWIDPELNPGLYAADGSGLTPIEVLERIAAEFDRQGFYILLDHHRIDCDEIAPLWYTPDYSEAQWIDDLVEVAQRFSRFDGFLGMDLKNEPHERATWATGNPATDWNAAAERAAKKVLAAAPDTVVFVEGVAENAHCPGDYPWWWSAWGGNLSRARCHPLDLPADKLVLAPHVYGPTEGPGGDDSPFLYTTDPLHPEGNPGTPADLKTAMPVVWDQWFGRLADVDENRPAIVIGEFKTRYGRYLNDLAEDPVYDIDPGDNPRQRRAKIRQFAPKRARDKAWIEALTGYLTEKGITDSFWWAINGDGPTGGIYYGDQLPRADGTLHPGDPWVRIRRDIVNDDPDQPGLLNRFWAKSACFDGFDNDRDGLTDRDDPDCANATPPR